MELAQKIQKYLHRNGTTNLSRYPDIREAKAREYNDRIVSAKYAFNQTLTQAEIYVAGSLVSANGNNIKERIQTALKLLVERVCDKIGYITNFADEEYVLTLLRDQKNGSILPEGDINPQALRELSDYVERQTIGHKRISMKSIMEYFREIPYCFLELDIIALMARLFVSAEIAMTLSGEQILLQNHSPEKIFNYMSKKEYWEKLLINKRQKATELQINDVKEILQEVFNASPSGDDENSVFNCFEENRKNLEQSLKKISTQNQNIQYGLSWPGMDVVKRGQELLQKLEGISEPERLFAALTVDRNDWLDFGEDYDAVRSFYDTRSPSAKQTFGASLDYVIQYEQCKNLLIGNTDLLEVVEKMRVILDMKIPYGKIKELPPLNQAFRSLVTNIVESQRNVAISVVDTYKREFSAKKDTMKDCIIEKYLGELNSIQKQILHSSSIRDFPYFMESARHIMREMEREKVESIPEENRASDLPIKEISQTKPAPKLVILGTLLPQKGWVIHSEEDIDRHLAELKTRLCEELNSDGLRVSW